MRQTKRKSVDTVARPGVVRVTVDAPEDLWRAMKNVAMDRRTNARDIWIEAARVFIEANKRKSSAA